MRLKPAYQLLILLLFQLAAVFEVHSDNQNRSAGAVSFFLAPEMSSEYMKSWGERYANYFQQYGIELDIVPVPTYQTFIDKLNREQNAVFLANASFYAVGVQRTNLQPIIQLPYNSHPVLVHKKGTSVSYAKACFALPDIYAVLSPLAYEWMKKKGLNPSAITIKHFTNSTHVLMSILTGKCDYAFTGSAILSGFQPSIKKTLTFQSIDNTNIGIIYVFSSPDLDKEILKKIQKQWLNIKPGVTPGFPSSVFYIAAKPITKDNIDALFQRNSTITNNLINHLNLLSEHGNSHKERTN